MKFNHKLMHIVLFFLYVNVMAQNEDPEYVKVTLGRAEKIVEKLTLENPGKRERVKQIVAKQYRDLSGLHDQQEKRSKMLKGKLHSKPDKLKKEKTKLSLKNEKEVNELKESFLSKLNEELSKAQISELKDGLTYHVAPSTYRVYQDMLPDLTLEQKKYILEHLLEAREYAMMAGSAKEKHAWFGKYKGRINNFLSQEGYDLKKASEAMEARIGEK
jgi:hypothetical protein